MKSREDASVQPRTECISPPCCSFSRAGGWGHPWVGVSQLRDDALLKFLPPTSIPAHPQVLKLTETCPAGEAENTNPLHNLSEPQSLFHFPPAELHEPPEAGTDSPRHGSYFYQFGGNTVGIVPLILVLFPAAQPSPRLGGGFLISC